MTPKTKAKELINGFLPAIGDFTGGQERHATEFARRLALICVEEILSIRMIENMGRGFDSEIGEGEFWRRVKNEIKKL